MVLMYLGLFIDSPEILKPELKGILIGEKVANGLNLYVDVVDWYAPLAGWFEGLFNIIFGRSLFARHILAFFIIFSQAAFLGLVFIDKKAYAEYSFVPSLLYVLLFFFSFDTLTLSPELLGNGFLLLALNNLFKEVEFREQQNETTFNLGLFIGFASLFVFSYILFLFAALIVLVVYTRNEIRRFLLMMFGALLPHILVFCFYLLKDGQDQIWTYYYIPNLSFHAERLISFNSMIILGALPIFFLVISMIMLNREARFTKYQSQLLQVMFFWMIFGFLQILYSKDTRPQSAITLIPSFSFYIAHYLLLIRRRRLAELSFLILLTGLISISYLSRYGKVRGVNYESMTLQQSSKEVKNKKVVVLDNDMSWYKENSLGSSFLNWRLAENVFKEPDYYENVLLVAGAFKRDPPDIIIDPHHLMRSFLHKIPALKNTYRQTSLGYQKINN
jgi:hypothetical protein